VAGGELRFVLRTLLELKKAGEETGVLTEVVNLVVPSLNDSPKQIQAMCEWILEHLGPDVPVFFSRFTPQYQLKNLPQTPVETVTEARKMAMEMGLHYVYVGNVADHPGENTYCPKCRRALIERYGYYVKANRLAVDMCPFCGTRIPGIWY
jgi:pyruvate formate lyase activating enzyme